MYIYIYLMDIYIYILKEQIRDKNLATCKNEQRTIYAKVIASLQGSASYQMQLGLSPHFQQCRKK